MLRARQMANAQQFGMNGQSMGTGSSGGPTQHQPVSSGGPGQPHLQGNFANAPAMQQGMSRNAMLNAFHANQNGHPNTNPQFARQLELMMAQQNQQQPQNNQMAMARMEQHRQQQQQLQNMASTSQGDLFNPTGMSDRSSPSHPNGSPMHLMGLSQSQGTPGGVQARKVTAVEISERIRALQANIASQEAMLAALAAQTPRTVEIAGKMASVINDLKFKKDTYARMHLAMQNMGV
jgi:hypothetical protein